MAFCEGPAVGERLGVAAGLLTAFLVVVCRALVVEIGHEEVPNGRTAIELVDNGKRAVEDLCLDKAGSWGELHAIGQGSPLHVHTCAVSIKLNATIHSLIKYSHHSPNNEQPLPPPAIHGRYTRASRREGDSQMWAFSRTVCATGYDYGSYNGG